MDDNTQTLAGGDPRGVTVHAGFPNPAADRQGTPALNLDRLLVRNPSSTYLFRIQGDDWLDRGIFDGDIAIIDRALDPQAGDLILTWHDEQFIIRRLGASLAPLETWGVIRTVIHQYRKNL